MVIVMTMVEMQKNKKKINGNAKQKETTISSKTTKEEVNDDNHNEHGLIGQEMTTCNDSMTINKSLEFSELIKEYVCLPCMKRMDQYIDKMKKEKMDQSHFISTMVKKHYQYSIM